MSGSFRGARPTIGVLAGWQYYWTATPLSYLNPIYRGIRQAAGDLGCNLLLGCGMGPSAASTDPLRPAWPFAILGKRLRSHWPVEHRWAHRDQSTAHRSALA